MRKYLEYAESAKCDCGARLARDDANQRWDCSDILLGIAIPKGRKNSKPHSGVFSYAFYKITPEVRVGWLNRAIRRLTR
jgi:hypothetical protein